MDIHKIVNANDLFKKCMNAIPQRKGSNMVKAYKLKMEFDKYLESNSSDMDCAKNVTKFIHRGKHIHRDNTYVHGRMGDNSHFSAYDVLEGVLEGEPETGNCLGTSQVCAYLLGSKGMDVGILRNNEHILIDAKVNEEWFSIETTTEKGFDAVPREMFESRDVSELESLVFDSCGATFLGVGEHDLSIDFFTKAIEMNKELEIAYNNRGAAWYKKGKYDQAILDFTKSIKLNKEFESSYANRAAAWYRKGEWNLAIKDCSKAIGINKELVFAYNIRGNSLTNKKKYDLAIRDFTKAIEMDSEFELAYNNRGSVWAKKGEYGLAIKDFEEFASFSENNATMIAPALKHYGELLGTIFQNNL